MNPGRCRAGAALLLAAGGFFCPPAAAPEPLIRLLNAGFDPLENPPLPVRGETRTGYRLVQFEGPIQESWKESLKTAGGEILDYIPDYAFIVRIPEAELGNLEGLPGVRWTGPYLGAYRLDSALSSPEVRSGKRQEVTVILFPGADPAPLVRVLENSGGELLWESANRWKTRLRARVSGDKIEDLAEAEGVKWIEPAPRWGFHNNRSRTIAGVSTPWTGLNLYGTGQVVAVADSGIDRGTDGLGYIHPDFLNPAGTASRIVKMVNLSSGTSDKIGHGTHVAGSIAGNGKNSGAAPASRSFPDGCYAGIAPEAGSAESPTISGCFSPRLSGPGPGSTTTVGAPPT